MFPYPDFSGIVSRRFFPRKGCLESLRRLEVAEHFIDDDLHLVNLRLMLRGILQVFELGLLAGNHCVVVGGDLGAKGGAVLFRRFRR